MEKYSHFEAGSNKADTKPPSGEALHRRAKASQLDVSAGMDGWKPFELKYIPLEAWERRAELLELCMEQKRYPSSYNEVMAPSIPKKDKGNAPLDHRLLAIFIALYRIEAGAWFDQLGGWLQDVLHPDVIGAIPARERAEIAWNAQSFLEHAMLNGLGGAVSITTFVSTSTHSNIISR